MDFERWRPVDGLLQAAGERPPGERAEFLREACGGDAELEWERYHDLFGHEIADTLADPAQPESELRSLTAVLTGK